MQKLSDKRTRELLEAASYEVRNTEFKSPFAWTGARSRWLKEQCTRTVLGMSNTRSGGDLVIGIEEGKNKQVRLKGLTDKQVSTFEDYDGIKGFIDGFASPNTIFDLSLGIYRNKKFVVFNIQDFEEIPVICRKNGQEKDILRKDDIYVRSKKAQYSTIRAGELELREIIDMAVDKQHSNLVGRGWVRANQFSLSKFYKKQIKDLD